MCTIEALDAALRSRADIEIANGAAVFLDWPDRWWTAGRFRCINDHVSGYTLKTDEGSRCLACYERLHLTFPEDQDGPLMNLRLDHEYPIEGFEPAMEVAYLAWRNTNVQTCPHADGGNLHEFDPLHPDANPFGCNHCAQRGVGFMDGAPDAARRRAFLAGWQACAEKTQCSTTDS